MTTPSRAQELPEESPDGYNDKMKEFELTIELQQEDASQSHEYDGYTVQVRITPAECDRVSVTLTIAKPEGSPEFTDFFFNPINSQYFQGFQWIELWDDTWPLVLTFERIPVHTSEPTKYRISLSDFTRYDD